MKIIPLFIDDDKSSKLLYIENINYINLEMVKEYKTLRFNCNFSINYLNKFIKLNRYCIIIFNDFKLFLSRSRYYLRNSKLSDGYRIIFRLRNSNYIKYVTNFNSKLEILNALFDECKFYLDCEFNKKPFIDLINILNIYDKLKFSNLLCDNSFLIMSKTLIDNYFLDLINNFSIDDIDKILKTVIYLESKNMKKNVFMIILDRLKKLKFNDSLLSELLDMITLKEVNDLYFINLIKLIDIDKKSKNLLLDIKLCNVSNKSIDLYYSILTRTNWLEELEYGNIMGLLLNIRPKEINKTGYNLDYIPIGEITHTIIGFDQILEAYKMSKTNDSFNNILSGYGVGQGNCILPLYISCKHWEFVKLYMDFNIGIIFNRNPLLFNDCHKNVYKNVLINMINYTFSDDNYKSDKWINLLFSVLRTNYELFGEDYNLISKFINDRKYRITCNLNNILLDYLFSKEDNNVINIIFEELVRRTFRSLYKNVNILDSIFKFTINSALNYESNYKNYYDNDLINIEEFNNWIINLESNHIFSEKITLMYAIIKMREMIMKNDFIYKFDNNYGILDDDNLNFIKNFIINKKIVPENGDLFGLLNEKFKNHINYTKDKIFSMRTFINLGLVENNKQLYNIFIQGILQRVDKCRKKALENNKIENPFLENNIIKNAGLLISHRFIKKFFGLDKNINYLYTINVIDKGLLVLFVDKMIKKTVSIKKYILDKIEDINEEKREIVKYILDSK